MNGIGAFTKECQGSCIVSFTTGAMHEAGSSLSETQLASALVLGSSNSKLHKVISVLSK